MRKALLKTIIVITIAVAMAISLSAEARKHAIKST